MCPAYLRREMRPPLHRPAPFAFNNSVRRIQLHCSFCLAPCSPVHDWSRFKQLATTCRRRCPKAPRRCGPPAIVALVTLLVTPQNISTNLQYLQASFHRLEQTNTIQDRTGRVVTQITRHSTRCYKTAGKSRKRVQLQNVGGYKIYHPHAATFNLAHY